MALQAGQKLGPYEIVALLGAGGMGEVYRARDARLGREVAVKILPASLASNEERRRRFEQHDDLLGRQEVGQLASGARRPQRFCGVRRDKLFPLAIPEKTS